MSERFLKFIKIVLKFENGSSACGYVNDPDDKGGETVSGICRKNYPNLKIWKSLDEKDTLRKKQLYKPSEKEWNEIYATYHKEYYRKIQGDYYNDENLALNVFDMAVNSGALNAIKMLQRLLHINVDGIVGKQTIKTSNNKKGVCEAYRNERRNYYKTIARKGRNSKFLKGWLKRVDDCHT